MQKQLILQLESRETNSTPSGEVLPQIPGSLYAKGLTKNEYMRKYNKTFKRIQWKKRYRQTLKYKKYNNEYQKKYIKNGKGKKNHNKYNKSKKGKAFIQKSFLKRTYNITIEEYKKIKTNQNNKCAICNIDLYKEKSCIDHNHINGKVRGILCRSCNWGIGHLKDNIKIIQSAVDYLKKHGELDDK